MTEQPVYLDSTQSIDTRVADLLARMTLEEKLGQIGGMWSRALMEEGVFSEGLAQEHLAEGIGEITRVAGATSLLPAESATVINAMQRFLVEKTRLGIPAIIHEESLAGLLSREATCFPQAIGFAATWNPELITAMADIIRQQMLAIGARHALAPVLDIARDPRWGRTEETLGEDPYLTGVLGTAYVRGLETDDLREGVAATGKHFVGYSASEGGLNWAPAHIQARELHEIYVRPFEMVIKEAGIATIMNAYHEMDGVPCGSSKELLVDLLRDKLGFKGAIVSDYFTIENFALYHHTAADFGEAALQALEV
ncbi:MAG: beta-glucosidase, partial [Anaerolineae bacterium]|nr:beta-glucosidase [Anaerolineae bacterium]